MPQGPWGICETHGVLHPCCGTWERRHGPGAGRRGGGRDLESVQKAGVVRCVLDTDWTRRTAGWAGEKGAAVCFCQFIADDLSWEAWRERRREKR
ncbi:hypothetical protein IF1G_06804 [Cordyceps javanica]|uniref:Uncharacterized protein n=1 Tax=Cordyceps javanica TaxID=43265 RepID=A0A545UZB7_9HYPO|nr:hypothetical protein IF1G_06804 [Cordyceps javanica]